VKKANFELLVLAGYAVVIVACAWGFGAMGLATWLAVVLGIVVGLGAALVLNALIVFALGFRKPPEE
jgi:hypothetical protein